MLRKMEADGVVERYAVGGAVGATFYLEPVSTLGVDVFIAFQSDTESAIVSPKPILDYHQAFGCKMEAEHIGIAGWPVQFLPATRSLIQKALENSLDAAVNRGLE